MTDKRMINNMKCHDKTSVEKRGQVPLHPLYIALGSNSVKKVPYLEVGYEKAPTFAGRGLYLTCVRGGQASRKS